MGGKPGFFPSKPTPQLQEKAGFPSSNHFFVLYTEFKFKFKYKFKFMGSVIISLSHQWKPHGLPLPQMGF